MEHKLIAATYIVAIPLLVLISQGCRSNCPVTSYPFISQVSAEAKALDIANASVREYRICISRFHPPFWTVDYEFADGHSAYVSMDLHGNLIKLENLPNSDGPNRSTLPTGNEISREEAIALASNYLQQVADDVVHVYADYHLAEWDILLSATDMPEGIQAWKMANRLYVTVSIREDGLLCYPDWLACQCPETGSDAIHCIDKLNWAEISQMERKQN